LRVVFEDRRRTGRLDLEATEMATRSALHRAGAAAWSQRLEFPIPRETERTRPCSCGQQAHYRELRSKTVLTALGPVEVSRPYYLCAPCGRGQFPIDVELDIENTEFSPGVRRMQVMVGHEAPFDHGREQMKVLAGLEVTTKSVERTAEAIGANIAPRQRAESERALQLELPVLIGKPIRILYVQMDGTGIPVVKEEAAGRAGKISDSGGSRQVLKAARARRFSLLLSVPLLLEYESVLSRPQHLASCGVSAVRCCVQERSDFSTQMD
jgi:hypothetical protein